MLIAFVFASLNAAADLPPVTTTQYDSAKLVSFLARNRAKLANWGDATAVSDADVAKIKAEFCSDQKISPCKVKFSTQGKSVIASGVVSVVRGDVTSIIDVPSGKALTFKDSNEPDFAASLRVCADAAGGTANRVVRIRRARAEGGQEIALLQFPGGAFREYQSRLRSYNMMYAPKPGYTGPAIKDNDIPTTFVDDGTTKFECLREGDSRIASLYAGGSSGANGSSGTGAGAVR